MPKAFILCPEVNGNPDLQLQEGESLKYSIGFVDVWRDSKPKDSVEVQPPDDVPDEETNIVPDSKWTKKNPVDGGWISCKVIIEEEEITGHTVIRRNWTNIEDFRGGITIVSPTPAYAPINTLVCEVTTTESNLNDMDADLVAIDKRYGLQTEIEPDA